MALKLLPRENKIIMEFYDTLDPSYRTLIDIRLKKIFGRSFAQLVSESPTKILEALSIALGRHNAEIFLEMFIEWSTKKLRIN